MKKTFLLTLLCLFILPFAFGQVTNLSLSWSATVGGNTGNPSCGTYNWATGHFLVCDYAALTVRIAIGTDGSLTGGTLSTSGLTLGSLGVFAICATKDGVIYGGTNIKADSSAGNSLIRWENEGATPTQQDPAEPLGTAIEFPRSMDAVGTGTGTIVGVTGTDDYKVTFLTTTDGTTFSVTDNTTVASLNVTEQIKQGVALAPTMNKVYGTKADGSGLLCRMDTTGVQLWAAYPSFVPPDSSTAPPTGLGVASPVGYVPNLNAVFTIGNSDGTNDYLSVLDGETGAFQAQIQIGQNVGTYGYGTVDLDEEAGEGYFIARSGTASSFVCGKITFDPWIPPTKANVWSIYE